MFQKMMSQVIITQYDYDTHRNILIPFHSILVIIVAISIVIITAVDCILISIIHIGFNIKLTSN